MLRTATSQTIINMIIPYFSLTRCGARYECDDRKSTRALLRCLGAVLVLIPLAGCGMHRELDRMADQRCQSYGARPGTDLYVKCRMAEHARDYGTGGGGGGGTVAPVYVESNRTEWLQPMPSINHAPVNCQRFPSGNIQCQ